MDRPDTKKISTPAPGSNSARVERAREEVAVARALTALVFAVKLDLADKKADHAYQRGVPSHT